MEKKKYRRNMSKKRVGQVIYLGPSLRTKELHLQPMSIFKEPPNLPSNFDFLKNFIVPVNELGSFKEKVNEWPEIAAKIDKMFKEGGKNEL